MDLIGPEHLSNNFVRHLKSLTPSMSVFMVFLGLKDIKRHGLMDKTTLWYIHKSYSAVDKFDDIYKDIYAGKVDMDKDHVVITAALDEQTITMYVGVPYKDERYWQRQKNSFCENIIKRAERLIPGIMANIAVKETATPSTFYKYTLNHKGAMYGWASSPGQIGADIMPVATPIQKLFLCSHWSTTGLGQGGIMSVAYTAMKTSEYLLSQKQEGRSYVSF
jgi:prolycopene isomerase